MGSIKRTVNVEEQVTGGARCATPKIVWDEPLCAGISCIRNDGREIDVVIPDECTERCFWVTYSCDDYSTNCNPIRLKVCPCTTDAECESCSKCDPIWLVCVSQCDPGEFCTDHDTCVECDENHPCTNGKQCVGGDCVCPPEKPYIDSNGNCAPCTDDSCPEGTVCTPDGCVPPVCPSGVWHVEKKECVQCINTGDCGPGRCCNPVTNKCECCPGFILDANGDCISAPCTLDTDCPACTFCKTGVGCQPVICPDGKVCIPGKGCVPECNCSNPSCVDAGSACVRHSNAICYCNPCGGSCANGQACGEGCFCDTDLVCKPNPCANVTCTTGSECGKGCGCNQLTHKCEPCNKAACGTECDNLLGCECPNGTSCQDVQGCDGPCDGYGKCPFGCTCVAGTCVSCSDFSCLTNDCASRPECICTGTGCEGDINFCKDTFVAEDFSCGVMATLTLKEGCMCPGITVYGTPHVIAASTVGNERRYTVVLALRLAKGSATSWEEIKTLHLLDETQYEDIADNDTPTSGALDLTVTEYYQLQVWAQGSWVNQGGIVARVIAPSGSISFAGIARKENLQFVTTKIGTGKNVIVGVSQEKIVRYDVAIKAGALKFPNNCTYNSEELPVMMLDSGEFKATTDTLDTLGTNASYSDLFIHAPSGNYNLGGKFVTFDKVMSSSQRDPLVTWHRSEDNVYTDSDIVRKLYIAPDALNVYIDALYGPATFPLTKQNLASPEGRVFGDMYYKVTNDCSCGEREVDFGNLKWCSPESLLLGNVIFTNCNKKIEIKSDIGRPCVTNWDLREHTLHPNDNNPAFKARHQAKYHLVVTLEDGSKVDRAYIWRETGVGTAGLYNELDNTPLKNYTQTFTSPVVSLKIELRYGTSTEVVCEAEKPIPPMNSKTPSYSIICEPGSTNIKYRFPTAVNHIVSIVATGGTVVPGAGYIDIVAPQGQVVSAYFTFTDYCPLTMDLNEFCCSTLNIDFIVNQVPGPQQTITAELTSLVTGGTLPYSVEYYRQVGGGTNELVGASTNSVGNFKVLLPSPTPGLYFSKVIDGSTSCSKDSDVISIDPRNPDDYTITIEPTFIGCTYTGNVKITIPNQPDMVGSKIYYKVNNGADIYFTVTNQMLSVGYHLLPAIGQTITLVRIEIPNQSGPPTIFPLSGSATVPTNLNADVPILSTFTLNGMAPSVNICAGSEVLIELQGTPNSVVNIQGIAPIFLDGSGYGVSSQFPTTTTTYTVLSVTNAPGDCSGTQGIGLTRQASVTPLPAITVISDVCDGTGTFRTVTFSNITSATDQAGNTLVVTANTVTVNVNTVTEIRASYSFGICTATYTHIVTPCGAPVITGTVTGPDSICLGESALISVTGVTGGTPPYSYNYYINADYNEVYNLGETSKSFALTATDTVFVRVMDALGNIAPIGSKTVTVSPVATPNIIPAIGQQGVTEISDNIFEIFDSVTEAIFKTALSYASYTWQVVSGTYTGSPSGGGPTFAIDVAEITGTIELKVTVVTENGCVGEETVAMSVVSAPVNLLPNEILFSTGANRLNKVALTTVSIGPATVQCGPGNPVYSLAIRPNGEVISRPGLPIYRVFPFTGCGNVLIGNSTMTALHGMTFITADKFAALRQGNIMQTFDVVTLVTNLNHYTIATNYYGEATSLVKIGTFLYAATSYRTASGQPILSYNILRFTLDGAGAVTAFADLGALPAQPPGIGPPVGMHYDGVNTFGIYSDGRVYNLNLTTPSLSTFIGTIIVPFGEGISHTT